MILKAFTSWSGGKDSMLALYRAIQGEVDVPYLLNMLSEDGLTSRSHGLNAGLLKAQAKAMGKTIVQRPSTWEGYEGEFKKVVMELKENRISAGVFGDIELQEHRDWIERVCREVEIEPLFPLWGADREGLLSEFVGAGFKAIVVCTQANVLGKEWLGREVDWRFLKDLRALGNVDLCGENGEYHSFVFNGPIFKGPVKFEIGGTRLEGHHWFLEITHEEGS